MSNVYVISPNNAKLVSLSEEELVLGTPKLCFGMCLPRFEATLNSDGIQMVVEVNAYINLTYGIDSLVVPPCLRCFTKPGWCVPSFQVQSKTQCI